ncbi:MAG TPA: IgGFc-binding protein [Flavobacteriales bacterium]
MAVCIHGAAQTHRAWVGFMQNAVALTPTVLRVDIAGAPGTTGQVSLPQQGWAEAFVLPAEGFVNIQVPATALCVEADTVEGKGILVESGHPVTITASNTMNFSGDATMILDETQLGTDHRAMAYRGSPSGNLFRSELLVLATMDSTQVEITPSCPTSTGRPAGEPFNVTLQAGQTYLVLGASAGDDLTGTRVRIPSPTPCQRLAVFGGTQCGEVPLDCSACDHLYEQMPPLTDWGTRYLITPFHEADGYTYRVLAAEDSTVYHVNGIPRPELMAGGFHETSNVSEPLCITSNKPVAIGQYKQSFSCAGWGDPSLLVLRADDRRIQRSTFSTLGPTVHTAHRMDVVVDTSDIGSLLLDGVPVPVTAFTPFIACDERAWTTFEVAFGRHTLEAPSGFSGTLYGTTIQAYGYSLTTPLRRDSIVCVNGDTIILQAPPGMVQPIWSIASGSGDTLGTGPVLVHTVEGDADILVQDGTFPAGCTTPYIYRLRTAGWMTVSIAVDQPDLCPPSTAVLVAGTSMVMEGMQFHWQPPTVVALSELADSVQVILSAPDSYTIEIRSTDGCLLGSSTVSLGTHPAPVVPIISEVGDALTSTSAVTYTWQLDGEPIPGANGMNHQPTSNGSYTVIITDANGCEATSAPYPVLALSTRDPVAAAPFRVHYVSESELYISGEARLEQVEVWTLVGQKIFSRIPHGNTVDVPLPAAGPYLVRVRIGAQNFSTVVMAY